MIINERYKGIRIILASQSPRRQSLLKDMGVDFEVLAKNVDEAYPDNLKAEQIPLYLCRKKAAAFDASELHNALLITADTVVWQNSKVLDKPKDQNEAKAVLSSLSGSEHEVITAVCLRSLQKQTEFFTSTRVFFKELSEQEIDYYIERYKPYDKAGAYGIQEWIGYIGIYRIEGSYYNVMGLPTQKLYDELMIF